MIYINSKTVVVFAFPGAFPPTCSSTHLPGYNELAPLFRECGVDDILCISVNDAFVMNEWGKTQQAKNVRLIPDGNGEFTAGMGMLVDKEDLGFGKRSWRYSMLVKDGVIEKMFIEPEEPGDPFKVSDAETMLCYLNPNYRRQCVSLLRSGAVPTAPTPKRCLRKRAFITMRSSLVRGLACDRSKPLLGQRPFPKSLLTANTLAVLKHWRNTWPLIVKDFR